jgi:death on curing protein
LGSRTLDGAIVDVIEPVWLRPEFIRRIHDHYLVLFGGLRGVRDADGVDACAARALWKFKFSHASLAECAAAYAYAFATGHPFRDGNKRTAFFSAVAFVLMNDCAFDLESDEAGRDTILEVAAARMTEDALAAWFGARISPRPRRAR